VNQEYYILLPDGTRAGPCAEEDILDLLESGDLDPNDQCLHAESGRILPAGQMFHVITPEPEPPPAPVAWQPAPFPDADTDEKPAPKLRPKLLYRGSPSALNYWRSTILAGIIYASGVYLRHSHPDIFLLSQICGSLILLSAILRLLRTQYFIITTRVEMRSGLLSPSTRELPLRDIQAIHLEHRGLFGLLGIGTVTFSSIHGPPHDVTFRQVWRASALKKLVRKLQGLTGAPAAPH